MEMSKIVAVIGQMNVDLIYKDINRFPNEGEEEMCIRDRPSSPEILRGAFFTFKRRWKF